MPLSSKISRRFLRQQSDDHRQDVIPGGLYELSTRHNFAQEVLSEPEPEPEPEQDLKLEAAKQALLATARQEAQTIVETARNETMAMAEKARQQATKEALQAKNEAAEQGYTQGLGEGLAAAAAEAEAIRAKARHVLEQAEQARRERLAAVQNEVLQLAVAIAEKVLSLELTTNPDVVLSVAEEALQLVAGRESVVLWVHPADQQQCLAKKERFLSLLPPQSLLQVMTDEDIDRGGCIVETTYGQVDATIVSKWENLIKELSGGSGNHENQVAAKEN